MHGNIIFVTTTPTKPIDDLNSLSFELSPEGLYISNYVDSICGKAQVPPKIGMARVDYSDGFLSFVCSKKSIEAYFSLEFEKLKKVVQRMSLEDFCEPKASRYVKAIIEDSSPDYIVCTDPNDIETNGAMTLNEFFREVYYNDEQTFYVYGCLNYHGYWR